MGPRLPVYMDYNATTPVDPRVVEAMLPTFVTEFGNPSSDAHLPGRRARELVEQARERIAALLGAHAREIIFTSGATESCNLAIKGAAEAYAERGRHLITALSEHHAVIAPCTRLQQHGYEIGWLRPDKYGQVHAEQVEEAITSSTTLVSIMAANNVLGTINPIAAVGAVCKRRGVLFHCDATQAVGKIPIHVEEMGIDLLSFSAHKIYGPKGIGALYVRGKQPRVRLVPLLDGGGQERGLRSGTLNVHGIVGFASAGELCRTEMGFEAVRTAALRDRLEARLRAGVPDLVVHGHPHERLPNTLSVSFPRADALLLLRDAREVAASAGSACTSEGGDPHYVLRAIGIGDELAGGSLRFSVGRFSTEQEVDYAAGRIVAVVVDYRRWAISF